MSTPEVRAALSPPGDSIGSKVVLAAIHFRSYGHRDARRRRSSQRRHFWHPFRTQNQFRFDHHQPATYNLFGAAPLYRDATTCTISRGQSGRYCPPFSGGAIECASRKPRLTDVAPRRRLHVNEVRATSAPSRKPSHSPPIRSEPRSPTAIGWVMINCFVAKGNLPSTLLTACQRCLLITVPPRHHHGYL